MTEKHPVDAGETVVIVGAGVFGLSTALELKKRGYSSVTVLDRYLPPVIDGSSVDISRVIRTDYADPMYGKMAREAFQGWQREYKDFYYHSGFVMLSNSTGNSYIEKSQEVNESLGSTLEEYENAAEVVKVYPNIQAKLEGVKVFHNPQGGWADAEASIRHLAMQCSLAGVSFITGARGTVKTLVFDGNSRVTGVKVANGEVIRASQVILSAGAWTNRLVPVSHATSASGQPVGFIQLTPEEAMTVADTPVVINLSTGVFTFPPTPGTNILKVARHSYGFATRVQVDGSSEIVSSPKRDSDNASTSYLPSDADAALREGLHALYPAFADRPWMTRRLCWYSDTQKGDFVIDHHPTIDGLFLATGGAGHAFKFLPVLGRYIVDCYENKASKELREKWRLTVPTSSGNIVMSGDGSRGGPPLRTLEPHEQAKL